MTSNGHAIPSCTTRIVLWGTYDTGKPRIRILRDGLRELGITVDEIHAPIWEDVSDKSSLHGFAKWLTRGLRLFCAYPRLVWRYLRAPAHDAVLVSYPGQLDALVLRPFAWLRRKPLVLDWFISAYDTVVNDRRLISPRHPVAWLMWCGEWLAAHAATYAFMDTAAHARRMEAIFHLRPDSVGRVWVGAEPPFFQPQPIRSTSNRPLQVLFYGQFIPLHGIETIVGAARLTRAMPIRWTLIGRGQDAPRIRKLLADDPLSNVEWIDWVDYPNLPAAIAHADVCLGIFGSSGKAASVIPNKVFQIVAMGKPLVTCDSPAVRELLANTPPCTQLITPGDAEALARAVGRFLTIDRTCDAPRCHHRESDTITARAIARQFQTILLKFPPRRGHHQ